MGSDIFAIGVSGLQAAQIGLATTGHNIANASTPGYSVQTVDQTSAGGQDFGSGFIGKGTAVNAVVRAYDSFLTQQTNTAQSNSSLYSTYSTQISQINNLFADSTAGVSPVLQKFFGALQTATSDPNSAAARQTVVSSAQGLVSTFQSVGNQLTQMEQGVNTELSAGVQTVNNLASQIATLNLAIANAQQGNAQQQPNDLLDQRDKAIADLNKQVKVTVVPQDTGYNVFIGNGQPLVVNTTAFSLKTVASPTDNNRLEIAYQSANGSTINLPESEISGGNLGGLLQFRSQTLLPTENSLGQVAIGFTSAFNNQQVLGQDQNGNLGTNFFTVGTPTVNLATTNTGNAVVTAAITNTSALTASDYSLQYDGTNYNLTRLSDSTVVYSGGSFPPASVDGVQLTLASGSMNTGDSVLIRPTYAGASSVGLAFTDITKLAFAAPIRTVAPATNTGTGTISAGTVNTPPPPDPNLQQPVTITFTSPTTYDVTGTGTGLPSTGNAYVAGSNISFNGWTVQVSGAPKTNDTFSVGPNTNGVGDGRNGILLGALQTTNLLNNGTATIQGVYAATVSSVGATAAQIKTSATGASTMLTSATNAQQSFSGVNLDEEATNLIRYQQAYQASSKVIQTADTLFQNLMAIFQ